MKQDPPIPTKTRWVFVLALALIGLFIFVRREFAATEPVHGGRSLAEWSDQWRANRFLGDSRGGAARQAADEAETAIRQIGTNAIPFLLEWMRAREAPAISRIKRIVPRTWHARLQLRESELNAMRLNSLGANGLAALGTNAAPAVPVLIKFLETPIPTPDSTYRTIWSMKYLGPAAEPAVPILIECLKAPDSSVRDEAAMALGWINRRAAVVVPALVSFLEWRKHQNGNAESVSTLYSLGMFGTNASSAAPTVLTLLGDSDYSIRTAATNCIERIDPAAAWRAGIRGH